MAQPSFKADGIQIEPAATGTRTITRDSTTNALKFIDPDYTSGVLLADLVGLQTIPNVSVVGLSYDTIQEAIDASTTGGDTPVVIIPVGEYSEDLTISKNVMLVGLGYVKITNATAASTITISEDVDGVPEHVVLKGLTIECTEDGLSCVDIDGSNTFATGTVTVNTTLAAGDTITIDGAVLTGIAGTRTSGSDDFNASLGTVAALAAEIAAAINDVSNSFAATVSAEAALGVVTLQAVTAGAGGNAITLAVSTTPGGGLTESGATLTGGGGVDSTVGATEILIDNCVLVASGVGTRQVSTQTVNNVRIQGGTWYGSSSTSESFVAQTASFKVFGVEWLNDVQAAYDIGDDQPIITTSEFSILSCGRLNTLITNYIGAGSVLIANIPVVGDVTINGDRTMVAMNCEMGTTLIEDTVVARLVNSTRDSLAGAGTPTVSESNVILTSALVAANTDTVTFTHEGPDTNYTVLVDVPTSGVVSTVTVKAVDSFDIEFSAPVTGTVYYTVLRQM